MNSLLLLPKVRRTHHTALHLFCSRSYSSAQFTEGSFQHPFTSLQCGTIIKSLTNSKSLKKGQQLHAHIITCGTLLENTYLSTKLAAFYASCGSMAEAHAIFDGIVLKNSFLWNSMIRGYACIGYSLKSLTLFRNMMEFGKKGDNFTYPFVLKACGDLSVLEIGKVVHGEVVVGGLESDVYVCNSLVAMYSKCGDMGNARMVFDRMLQRDLTSWNTIISGYVKNGDAKEALVVFDLMGSNGVGVDGTTLLALLHACANLAALKQGKAIHGYVLRNNDRVINDFLINSLIEMYSYCNSMASACQLFMGLACKDLVSWNSMIAGHARNGDALESLRTFCRMLMEGGAPDEITLIAVLGACDQITALKFGESVHLYILKKGLSENIIVGTSLIDMYSKCGSLVYSKLVFDHMPYKNLISWSAMIGGYGVYGNGREAIAIFHEMIENGIIPDDGVFTSVLSACSHAGLVKEGKEIFYQITNRYKVKSGLAHYCCMVDLLGRAGHLNEAYQLINSMEVKPTSDIWTALLFACRLHQNVQLAEISAQKLFDLNPKGVSGYVCLSNIYAAEKRWDDVKRVRTMVRNERLRKAAGCSFIELDKMVHRFLVADMSHPQKDVIYAKLKDLNKQLKEVGYKPDTSSVFYDVEEEVKEKMLWDHSERLAIAFALINTSPVTIIRITKNLRVCEDCHTAFKLISKLYDREIIMRDIRRFHHFKDGGCSCGDYW